MRELEKMQKQISAQGLVHSPLIEKLRAVERSLEEERARVSDLLAMLGNNTMTVREELVARAKEREAKEVATAAALTAAQAKVTASEQALAEERRKFSENCPLSFDRVLQVAGTWRDYDTGYCATVPRNEIKGAFSGYTMWSNDFRIRARTHSLCFTPITLFSPSLMPLASPQTRDLYRVNSVSGAIWA